MKSHLRAAVAIAVVMGGNAVIADEQISPRGPYRPAEPGVTPPVLLQSVSPAYPSEAWYARIQGTVELEAAVLIDGTVGPVRVVRSPDQRLDDAAVAAARNWLFQPGQYRGKAAPVIVTLRLDFRLSGADTAGRVIERPAPSAPWTAKPDKFLQDTLPEETPGLVMPTLVREVQPKYTREAMRRKIEGIVIIQAVVMPDGTVDRARVTTSLDKDFGLDEAALNAVGAWRFEPARLNRHAVAAPVELVLEFRLR